MEILKITKRIFWKGIIIFKISYLTIYRKIRFNIYNEPPGDNSVKNVTIPRGWITIWTHLMSLLRAQEKSIYRRESTSPVLPDEEWTLPSGFFPVGSSPGDYSGLLASAF